MTYNLVPSQAAQTPDGKESPICFKVGCADCFLRVVHHQDTRLPTLACEQLTVLDGGSGVCGRGTAAKMVESARRADLSLSSGLSSAFRFASLCSLFWGGGIPAACWECII